MMYDTKAILRTKWTQLQDKLLAEGWEYHKIENGVVFLHKQTTPSDGTGDPLLSPPVSDDSGGDQGRNCD